MNDKKLDRRLLWQRTIIESLLSQIKDKTFPVIFSSNDCGYGAVYVAKNISFSAAQLRSVILSDSDLLWVERRMVSKFNLDVFLSKQAESIVWPKVEVIAKVNHCLPLELKALVASTKKSKKPTLIDNIHSILGNIKGGYYTFSFHLADIHDEHWFVGNVSKQIKLKKREVLAILRHVCNDDELFSGIANTSLDEDFINKRAETIDFSADYPYKNITWYCEELDGYIELWESKIEQVVDDVRRLDNIYIDRQHEK